MPLRCMDRFLNGLVQFQRSTGQMFGQVAVVRAELDSLLLSMKAIDIGTQ